MTGALAPFSYLVLYNWQKHLITLSFPSYGSTASNLEAPRHSVQQ